jgi:hypothetical protein
VNDRADDEDEYGGKQYRKPEFVADRRL